VTGAGLGPLLVRSVTGTAAVRLSAMVASFAVGVLLARVLGVSGYGYYGMAVAVITLAGIPGEMGLPRLVTREVAAAKARGDMAVLFGVLRWADRTAWRISGLMAVGVLVAGFVIARQNTSVLVVAILCGVPMIPLLALARIRGGALQGLHYIVLGQIPDTLLRPILLSSLILIVSLTSLPFGPAYAMALNSFTAAVVFLVAFVVLRKRLPEGRPAKVAKAGRRWLASSIPMALTDGMRILQSELSVLLLGFLAVPADVGLFRIANITAFAAATPVAIINFVAFPVIARLFAEKDFVRLQHALTRLAQAQFAGVALLCLPLLLLPEPLLSLVFGSGFAPASTTLRILAGAQLFTSGFGLNVALLNMTHHERRVTRAMGIGLAVNIVGVTLLTLAWGRDGAAIGVACALVCWNILTWIDSRRILGFETSILSIPNSVRPGGVDGQPVQPTEAQ
jgi:O-antigen/teichoic acid export membrane protein